MTNLENRGILEDKTVATTGRTNMPNENQEKKNRLPKFNAKEDDWESYRMLVEPILEEKNVTEDRKKTLEFV